MKTVCPFPRRRAALAAAVAALTLAAQPPASRAQLDFTFVALPDTQKYLDSVYAYEATETTDSTLPAFAGGYAAQTQWIADNVAGRKIGFASQLGDLVEHGGGSGGNPATKPGIIAAGFFRPYQNRTEWAESNRAVNILNGAVPYAVPLGNHDYDFVNADQTLGILAQGRGTEDRSATQYLARFGPQRFAPYAYQAGTAPSATNFFVGASPNGLNTAQVFTGGGRQVLHFALEWEAPDAALSWAQGVINANPGLPVIISTHSYIWDQPGEEGRFGARATEATQATVTFPYPVVRPDGSFSQTGSGNNGQDIWNKFVKVNPAVFMVLNGHWSQPTGQGEANQNIGEWAQTSLNDAGVPVFEMLADYQDERLGGDGWLRLMEFRLGQAADGGDVLLIRTYSPTRDLMDDGLLNYSDFAFKVNDSDTWEEAFGAGFGFGEVDDTTVFPTGKTFDPRDSQFYYTLDFDGRFAAVPEPGTTGLVLLAGGALTMIGARRRRSRR